MPGKRRVAVWVGAAVVAAGAVAAVMAIRGGDGTDTPVAGPQTGSSHDAGRAIAGVEPETAPGLVEAARSEAAAGHYVKALTLYQRADALDPRPSTLLEVARMEHLSGRCREARRTTQRVLAASPGGEVADQAQQLLDRIGRCD